MIKFNNRDQYDWPEHHGLHIEMINDYIRNQFYENILKDEVKDKRCIEVGFGTGIMSMIALKHGARHILAFEEDKLNYALGKEIIDDLNLSNQIELVNEKYHADQVYKDREIIYHEIIGDRLWDESILNIIPKNTNLKIIPGNFRVEFYATPLTNSLAQAIICNEPTVDDARFHPGIDLNDQYVELVNKKLRSVTSISGDIPTGVINIEHDQTLYHDRIFWTKHFYSNIVKHLPSEKITEYTIDSNYGIIGTKYSEIIKRKFDQPHLILPVITIMHDRYSIKLDESFHWLSPNHFAIVNQIDQLLIEHSFKTGNFLFDTV